MIRVLHCVGAMNHGGVENFIMNIYREIDKEKIQFDFLVHTEDKCDFDEEIFSMGGKIFRVPPRNYGIKKNKTFLNDFFSKNNYQIIHQHLSSLSYIAPIKIAKKSGVPIRIIHGHSTQEGGNSLHKYLHYWNQLLIKDYATHYFACSDSVGKWMVGSKNYNNGLVKIIKNGIDTKKYSYDPQKAIEMKEQLGVINKYVVGHVGRLSYPKNHEFLIKVFDAFSKECLDAILILVGDGELREKIEQQIKNFKLEEKVLLLGKREDVADILQAMDIFIFPSHFEGLPLSLVEAQAAGLPCIVSESITKQVRVTENIEYLKINDEVYSWVNKMKIIKKDYKRKINPKNLLLIDFDIKKVVREIEEFYLKFLN